jgi:oligopeptide/dipeptide ABC transporter ATP-binding protein
VTRATPSPQADAPASSASAEVVLDVQALRVSYMQSRGLALRRGQRTELRAVDGVDLHVSAGELIALVGESGSGKTTTALASARLLPTDVTRISGSIRFCGEEITQMRGQQVQELRKQIQIIYQDPYESLDPRFRIQATVEEPLKIHHVSRSRRERRQLVEEALARVGLDDAATLRKHPHQLSGGQRQRVAIATALVVGPRLLIADEPVSMIDMSMRLGVLGLLSHLRTEGLAVLMITHDLATAARYADRVAIMYLGRIVEEGPTIQVLGQPQHPYTRALLAAVPDPDPAAAARRSPTLKGEIPDASRLPSGCRFANRCPIVRDECALVDPGLQAVDDRTTPAHQVACIAVRRANGLDSES